MAFQIQAANDKLLAADNNGVMFNSPRPIDHGVLGQYKLATTIAILATQAANGTLFSFRWADATRVCVIQRLRLSLLQTAAATATIAPSYQLFAARAFTVSDSIGAAIDLTGNNMKRRTNMAATLVTDIRKSTAAAGLTAGTRVLGAEPILELATSSTITTSNNTVYSADLDCSISDGQYPYVLAQNEGLVVRGPTVAFGAAGAANLLVELSWAELLTY